MESICPKYKQQIKIVIFLVVILISTVYYRQKQHINELNYQVDGLESQVSDLEDLLSLANENIDEANDQIINAQGYAWESYEDMGYVLDDLYEVESVRQPSVKKLRRPNNPLN